jgi:hypothetical protein
MLASKEQPEHHRHHAFHERVHFGHGAALFVVSLAALIWVLVRVIPKPSRASYPCMRVAMSLASGLIAQVAAFALSLFSLQKAREEFRSSKFGIAAALLAGALLLPNFIAGEFSAADPVYAPVVQQANVPMGVARGIFPGRVVWVHDSTATRAACNPSLYDHGWFLSENSDQTAIDRMLSDGLRSLTGKESDSAAWDAIFRFHNAERGKGDVGYVPGEKIFIKINATSAWSGNFNPVTLEKTKNSYYGVSETSPQMILAVLKQLVDVAGVAQSDIWVGDPMKHIYKHSYDLLHPEFPSVHYLDHNNVSLRERALHGTTALIHYSDHGTILYLTGGLDTLYQIFEDAEYLISLPMLKGHLRAGITAFAKNHFGSHTRESASHLHNGLVAPGEDPVRYGYGLYRVQVDLMGHRLLGKKNLVYIMDALWSTDYELDAPVKWNLPPFNGHWTSSVFLSFDPVAIESVGYDFLVAEFTPARGLSTCVQMDGVDDYLHQAADSTTWPAGFSYDPDGTGTHVGSLGVHEHWNNATEKQYSRNLGSGEGIELVPLEENTTGVPAAADRPLHAYRLDPCYPNPFNPTTVVSYQLPAVSSVRLVVYDLLGREVAVLVNESKPAGTYRVVFDAAGLASGAYICRLETGNGRAFLTQKMLLVR